MSRRRSSGDDAAGAAIIILGVIIFFSIFYFMWKGLESLNSVGKMVGGAAIAMLALFCWNRFLSDQVIDSFPFWMSVLGVGVLYLMAFVHKAPDEGFSSEWVVR